MVVPEATVARLREALKEIAHSRDHVTVDDLRYVARRASDA